MKTIKRVSIVILIIMVSFCVYVQYTKMKYDKIYENRSNYGVIYRDIYQSGALEIMKTFLFNQFDKTVTTSKGYSCHKFILYYCQDLTKDSIILSTADYLIDKGFCDSEIIYKDGRRNELSFGQTFLRYKHVPTHHYLIFSEGFEYKYRYAQDDKWFFHSSDEEADDKIWIDSRPDWLMPYFEAFSFFKGNPNWVHEYIK